MLKKLVIRISSWILLIGVIASAFFVEKVVTYIERFGPIGFMGYILISIVLGGLSLSGVFSSFDASPKKNPCELCHGSGHVPAVGAWVTEYDTQTCPRCKGTSVEPNQTSPFEEDGYCMTEDDL